MTKCKHKWEWVKDWEGDPNVVNGVQHFSYWLCRKCDALDPERDPPEQDGDEARDRYEDERMEEEALNEASLDYFNRYIAGDR